MTGLSSLATPAPSAPPPGGLPDTEARSADIAPRVASVLRGICARPDLHARFLNTLSLMEHVGSRKIMASQSMLAPDQETLKHLAEETRHAFFFKRAADRAAGRTLSYDSADTVARGAACLYMGRLDAHIGQAVSAGAPDHLAYLYMSLVVELRAVWFYRLYRDALEAAGHRLNLKSVLAEEELHLSQMRERLAALDPGLDSRLAGFADFEDGRFRKLWRAMETGCAAA